MNVKFYACLPFRFATWRSPEFDYIFLIYLLMNVVGKNVFAHPTTLCAAYASARSEEFQIGAAWNEPTRNIVTFYSALLAAGKLDEADLLRIRHGLVRGELVNPFPRIGRPATENNLFAKQVANLLIPQVNTGHVLVWIDGELHARGKEFVQREERKTETRSPFREMQLLRVEPGEFKMGEGKRNKNVVLTHPFEAMSTAVTQWMWVKEFGENQSGFANGEHTVEVVIHGKTIQMQPDSPVDNVTWWSMIEYANRVSMRMGLKPAFDLSKINFDPRTSAAKGNYRPLDGQTFTNKLWVNHPSHSIYQTEGLRPLTEAEWEFLARDRGRSNTNWYSGDTEADLKRVAWYRDNSDQKTHPVAQLDPLVVDGKAFYDLHGNVYEWVWDWHDGTLRGGTDPEGPSVGAVRVFRGGGSGSDANFCRPTLRNFGTPDYRGANVGVRLGRTIR